MKKSVLSIVLCIIILITNWSNITSMSVLASDDINAKNDVSDAITLIEKLKKGGNIVLCDDITTGELTVGEDATIDLNGYKLTADGIVISKGKTFTIRDSKYTVEVPGNGKLITKGAEYKAGIQTTDATLIIESGAIEATGDDYGAGIGGSKGDSNCAGKLIIKGGVVTATGGRSAAGIGGGADFRTEKRGGKVGLVTISGGTVVATGGIVGIGGGDGYWPCASGGSVTINDGMITTDGVVVIAGELKVNGGTVETLGVSCISASTILLKNCTVLGNNSFAGTYDEDGNCIKTKYEISVTSGLGGSISGGGIEECNKIIELSATPDEGYIFDGWYENDLKISNDINYSFTVTANRNLEARFLRIELDSISIDGEQQLEDMFIVECDKTLELNILLDPEGAIVDETKVQWISSDSDMATVENGIVTGKKEGYVTISVVIEGRKASCKVLVIDNRTRICEDCLGKGYENIYCDRCSIDGYEDCSTCEGIGEIPYVKKCTVCNSSGKVTQFETCVKCFGTGVSSTTVGNVVISGACLLCAGKGDMPVKANCSNCSGIGGIKTYIKCASCDGYGSIKCELCNGTKEYKHNCTNCKTSGKLVSAIYKISYDVNGGKNEPCAQVKIENSRLQISDFKPVREGYIFKGWALDNTATVADYMPGDYITEDKSIKLYAVWEEEKILTSISITQMPYKVSYIEGEMFDSSGLVVTAHYRNGTTQAIPDYEILGYESTPGEKRITITYDGKVVEFTVIVKIKIPQTISSSIYKVSEAGICKISIGTSIKEMLDSIEEKQYVKVFKNQTEVKSDEIVGTGMTAKIMDGSTVVKSYDIIVTGDVNGDGNATVTDMLAIKAHLLGKNKLSGEYATAADTSGDNAISITDFIQVKAKILGKGNITAR